MIAWQTLRAPEGSTTVLNAANEVAVAAFLGGTIRFDQIHKVIAETLEAVIPDTHSSASIDALLVLDSQARHRAQGLVTGLQ